MIYKKSNLCKISVQISPKSLRWKPEKSQLSWGDHKLYTFVNYMQLGLIKDGLFIQISWKIGTLLVDLCLKNLSNGRAPRPDGIPNNILKDLPDTIHDMLCLLFLQCYHWEAIPKKWKHTITILLHKKDNPVIITNYRPMALVYTI